MRGRVGTPVSFQLGVNASFRLEARLLQPEGSRGEVAEVATMEVRERRRNLSAGELVIKNRGFGFQRVAGEGGRCGNLL